MKEVLLTVLVRCPSRGGALPPPPIQTLDPATGLSASQGALGTAQPPLSGSVVTQEELLRWCQEQTAGYPGVHVTDLSSSWADGLALCALVNRLRPGLL